MTAKHVVATLVGDAGEVRLCANQSDCKKITVKILRCNDPVDIAVLVPASPVTVATKVAADMDGLMIGQHVYFVGYPYGDYSLTTDTGDEAVGFIRQALVSAVEKKAMLSDFGSMGETTKASLVRPLSSLRREKTSSRLQPSFQATERI